MEENKVMTNEVDVEEINDSNVVDTETNNIEANNVEEVDKDKKILDYLKVNSKLSEAKSAIDDIKTNINSVISDDGERSVEELGKYLDEKIRTKTKYEISQMTDDEIDDFFSLNEDESICLIAEFNNKKEEYQFKKDFLINRKETLEALDKFNEEIDVLSRELQEAQEELDYHLGGLNDMSKYVTDEINKKLETETDPVRIQNYNIFLKNVEYAYTLENLKEFINSYRGKKILYAYTDFKESKKIYEKYCSVRNKIGIKMDLIKLKNFENNFLLDDNCKKRPNIFIFSIMYMVANYKSEKEPIIVISIFLSHLANNISSLILDRFVDEDKKNGFIKNIEDTIRLFN